MKEVENSFERSKNMKATAYTIMVCGLLFLGFMLKSFSLPKIEQPIASEGIEVNLGDAENGLGEVQPEAIGEPAPAENNSAPAEPTPTEPVDEKGDEPVEAPTKTPEKIITKPKVTPIITPKPIDKKPVITKDPSPKATLGAIGKNGNNGSKNTNSKSQGDDFGNGDKGKPNGNPNSNSYTGIDKKGNGGLSIKSGLNGRKFVQKPSFKDEFTENAKVVVDVIVDANGAVTSTIINPRGTTTTNATIREIAKRKAKEIKFNTGKDEDFGTIVFEFRITD